uniref:Sodium/nucleoside cotransporter n=1 Tax=Plectus sambesii TaxID=2011161 RepID=A0A914XHR2_9BILA
MENIAFDEAGNEKADVQKRTAMGRFPVTATMINKDDPDETTGCMRLVLRIQEGVEAFMQRHYQTIKAGIIVCLAIALHVFLGFAIHHDFQKAQTLLILMIFAWIFLIYYHGIKPYLGESMYSNYYAPFEQQLLQVWNLWSIHWGFYILAGTAVAIFFVVDTWNDHYRLVSLLGLFAIIGFMFIFSKNPAKVKWRPVIVGCLLQFLMGIAVLRWEWGKIKFNQLSDEIIRFLDYTKNGTEFVYGFIAKPPNICGMNPVLAFTVLQVIIYFGAVVAILYYYGIVQWCVKKMAWAMALTMGTTAAESMNSVACTFFGMSEAPLLIKPYLEQMTASELHAVMTSGFACVAGSTFAAYVAFGACPIYLLSHSVMAAPAALAAAKLFYPETEESHTAKAEDLELPAGYALREDFLKGAAGVR